MVNETKSEPIDVVGAEEVASKLDTVVSAANIFGFDASLLNNASTEIRRLVYLALEYKALAEKSDDCVDDTPPPPPVNDTTIKIVAERSQLQVAPDSIGFKVDLSGSDFTTGAAASEDDYDPQYHDLYYYWNTGDQDSWTAPENVFEQWKSKQTAYGPFIRHMYTEPGTYTVGVTVIEPKTGQAASATLQVVVDDPDSVFAGENTICVSTDAVDTFTDAPAGSQQFTDMDDAQNALDNLTSPGRLLFKRGQSFVHSWTMVGVSTDVAFGAWGEGDKPIITMENGSPPIPFRFPTTYAGTNASRDVEVRFADLSFVGEWNPVDGSGEAGAGVVTSGSISFMFSSVDFDGFNNAFVHNDAKVDDIVTQTPGFHYHFDNMNLTNYQNYAVLSGNQLNANLTFTGCKLAQNVLAPQAIEGKQGGGSVRQGFARELYIAGCDFFHNMGHSGGTWGNNPFTWSSNRLSDRAIDDGTKINIHTTSFEGGAEVINFGTRSPINTKIANGLIHNCVVVGDHTTSYSILIRYAGFTVRNNLMILPDTPFRSPLNPGRAFVGLFPRSGNSHNDSDPMRNAPNKVYSNTFVGLRAKEDNQNWTYLGVRDNQLVPGSADENNILYLPKQGDVDDGPLDTTLLPWTPRNQGWRNGDTGLLDTDYAIKIDDLAFYWPMSDSPAIGSATGLYAYDDIIGIVRHPESPDKGASQVSIPATV